MKQRQRIAYAPDSQLQLLDGIARLNQLLSLTLGPTPNKVAASAASAVELLNDAGQVSKAVLSLNEPSADVGHQILRQALSEQYERAMDGVATCSVLTHALLSQIAPLLAFGYHPAELERDLRIAHDSVRSWLRRNAWIIDTPDEIAGVIRTADFPDDLAEIVAEIVDSIGGDGTILIEETRRVGIAYEYIRGGRWNSGIASPSFLGETSNQVNVRDPLVLVTDHSITTTKTAISLLEAAAGASGILIIAPNFSDGVLAILHANRETGSFESIIPVKAPSSVHSGTEQLVDIAIQTGGHFLPKENGNVLNAIPQHVFGRTERAWASRSAFGIIGGAGDPRLVESRAAALRERARGERDPARKAHIQMRAGNLIGLSALIRVGDYTHNEPSKRQVERAVTVAQHAIRNGVVEGGGAALARAGQYLAQTFRSGQHEIGATALARALEVPMATIIKQSGWEEPSAILHRLRVTSATFNVQTGQWVDARETLLLDPLTVIENALDVAVSTALMVLSTDVVIGRRLGR